MHEHLAALPLLDAAYAAASDPVVALDTDQRILYANPAALARAERSLSDLLGGRCYEVIFGRGAPCEGCRAQEAIAAREPRERELHKVRANGTEYDLVQRWYPMIGDDGEVAFVVDVSRDVSDLRVAERALEEKRAALEIVRQERTLAKRYLDVSLAIIIQLDPAGRIQLVNRQGRYVLGLSEEQILGRRMSEFVPTSDGDALLRAMGEFLLAEKPEETVEARLCAGDGRVLSVEWHVAKVFDEDGQLTGVLGSGLDVTARKAAERESEFRSAVLDEATDAVVVHRLDGTPLYANKQMLEIRGCTLEQFKSLPAFGWTRSVVSRVAQVLRIDGAAQFESALASADGSYIPVEVHAVMLEWNEEPVVAAFARDIRERKAAEATIERMAFYDALTGLANRQLFNDRLAHALTAARRNRTALALVFLDLDHFKAVNDSLGHRIGDRLLVKVAERLAVTVRESDTVARLGGDEFIVILEEVSGPVEAAALAARLLGSLDEPFDLEGERMVITASAGITITQDGETDAETLVREADIAMYQAKESGRKAFRMYEAAMAESARTRFDLKNELPLALTRGELVLHYQPQYSVADDALVGVEALVRWNHPDRGLLAPQAFLPVAEESGLIGELGSWVLAEACRQAGEWQRRFGLPLLIAVNTSAQQFENPKLVRAIEKLLAETGLLPHTLELEITESVAMRDAIYLRSTFERLREAGVRLAIDDFGKGFSSFDQLMRADVDTIKLDRRFISDLTVDVRAAAISSAVIFLGHSLGLRVVAEGVESEHHLEFLRAQDCDDAQGFLLGRPMAAGDFEDLLSQQARRVS